MRKHYILRVPNQRRAGLTSFTVRLDEQTLATLDGAVRQNSIDAPTTKPCRASVIRDLISTYLEPVKIIRGKRAKP